MKKIYIPLALLLVLVLLLIRKRETDFYIGLTGTSQYDVIDIEVRLNDKLIFDDSVYYHPHGYRNVGEKLRMGFHKIHVSSEKAAIETEKKIFLILNHHVVIEFYGEMEYIRDRPKFDIRVNSNPFYYE